MNKRYFIILILLIVAGMQTVWAQKVVLHMTGNQKAEYSVEQLDSITFAEVDSSGGLDATDPSDL